MTRRIVVFPILLLTTLLAAILIAAAQEAKEGAEHKYVSHRKCKNCHKPQHSSWLATRHAKAFDVLPGEKKKKRECLSCHATAGLADGAVLEGVQCEACHGPGSDYKSIKIMSRRKWKADPETYRKKAIDAGLVYPTEEHCRKCHKKEGNRDPKPFDFRRSKGQVHTMQTDTTATGK